MALDYLKTIEVSGDAFWVGTQHPDKFSVKGYYTMVVGNLSDKEISKIKALDPLADVAFNDNKPNQGKYIKLKSGYPINAADVEGNKLDVVGNGSKITVVVNPAKYDFAGKQGVNYWVGKKGVTVKDLVVYNPDEIL